MKRKIIICLPVICVVLLLFLWIWSSTPKKMKWEGKTLEKIQYSEVSEADYFNLYLPKSEEKLPLLILVHGGGFFENDCTSTEASYMYNYFRSQGYACASINYRLSQEAEFPAAVNDVKAAVRFLHANAEKYNLDEDRFIIWGESAGAYLATMTAVTDETEFTDVNFIGEETVDTTSSKIAALVDFYGPMEFSEMDAQFKQEKVPDWLRKITGVSSDGLTNSGDSPESLFVGTAIGALTQEQKVMISPYTYMKENLDENSDLKVYIRHGKIDITVPYLQSVQLATEFSKLLGEANVNFDIFASYKHADGRFYKQSNLEELKSFLADL